MIYLAPANLWLLFACLGWCLAHSNLPHRLYSRQAIIRPKALRNFEVREPPVVPASQPCDQVLLTYTFENSYGRAANASFSPPEGCGSPGSWASVIFNLTATSIGRQYDRLGSLYLNDIEVWRTSTAEPTKAGVVWTVTRDMTKYIPLLSQRDARLSLDIGNIVDKALNLDGKFEVTLSAKFYPPTLEFPASKTADQIINFGRGTGNNMTRYITFPQSAATAFVELFASGSNKEEFWYTGAPDQYTKILNPNGNADIGGKGPFREVQLWIDNRLAGVVYPFPVIYTGGILLSWWRPIAAIGAFDSPTYTIDITPFIPYLTDSSPHNFTLVVEGQGTKESINPEWIFSGSMFVTLDPSGTRTTGQMDNYHTDSKTTVETLPSKSIKSTAIAANATTSNGTFNFVVRSYRKLSISSTVVTGTGGKKNVQFDQALLYTNQQSWLAGGDYQAVLQSSSGASMSIHGGLPILTDTFSFPLNLSTTNTKSTKTNETKTEGTLTHSYRRSQKIPFSPSLGGISIDTTQNSEGELLFDASGGALRGVARTSQAFKYQDGRGETFLRDVEIFNSTRVIRDVKRGTLAPTAPLSRMGIRTRDSEEVSDEVSDDVQGLPCRTIKALVLPESEDRSTPERFVVQISSPNPQDLSASSIAAT